MILGAGALGRTVKELFDLNEVVVYGFLDDDKTRHNQTIDEVVVLGSTDDDGFLKLIGRKCEAFVAVDDVRLRKTLVRMLLEVRKTQPVNAIHRSAHISPRARLGHGNLIDTGVILAPGAEVGNYGLFHANTYVGAEAKVGDYVQMGVGAIIGPQAEIGDEVFIGAGVTIVAGVSIGKGARVGAGSVVIGPIKAGETVFGNPAKTVA